MDAFYNFAITPYMQLSVDAQWISPGIRSSTIAWGARNPAQHAVLSPRGATVGSDDECGGQLVTRWMRFGVAAVIVLTILVDTMIPAFETRTIL
jgi:hypothetical protein